MPRTTRAVAALVAACVVSAVSAVAQQTPHAALAATPIARAYTLGERTLTQTWLPVRDSNRQMPFRAEGMIATPDGPGPFPIVFVLHDAAGGCPPDESQQDIVLEQWPCTLADERRNDIGLSYLLSALAARGYVALAPNMNAVYAHAFGAVAPEVRRYPDVFDAHLQALIAANVSATSPLGMLRGKLDLNRIGMVGHGFGGLLAMQSARARVERKGRVPAGSQPLIGAVLVSPPYSNAGDVDMPLAVLLPECDGNTPDLSGQGYYEDARRAESRAHLAASVYVFAANSNFFNDVAQTDDAEKIRNVPGCNRDAQLLSRSAQRNLLSRFVADFLDGVLGNRDAVARAGLDATTPAITRLYGAPVLMALAAPTSQRVVVSQPRTADDLSSNALGGFSVAEGAARIEFCVAKTPCGRWPLVPGNPAAVRFSWTSPIGAAWDLGLGEKPIDLTDFAAIHLRVATDPSDALNAHRKPQAIRVTLVDEREQSASVRLLASDTPALAYAPGEPNAAEFGWLGHAFLSSVRVPVAEFAGEGVDLARISTIKIEGASENSGSLFLADLEFIRQQVGPAAE